MALSINSGWDVAHHHIHEAFIHIGQAYEFNCRMVKKYQDYKQEFHWAKLLGASSEVRQYFIAENKLSIKATILFQAGIEAWISWSYTKPELSSSRAPRHFVPKWEFAFKAQGLDYGFSDYAVFYREIRNPTVHPSQQSDIEKVSNIWCKPVYEGMKTGWLAMSELSSSLGQPFDSNSWEIMCNANNAPNIICESKVTDLQALEGAMLSRHLSGARGELDEAK
ncbi:MAG: hypothetical protein ACYST3_04030 [Planctomycetota bacterium]